MPQPGEQPPAARPTVTPAPEEALAALPPPTLPEGWRLYTDPEAGFKVAVKNSWTIAQKGPRQVVFSAGKGAALSLGYTGFFAFKTGNPLREMTALARDIFGDRPGRVAVESIWAEQPFWELSTDPQIVIYYVPAAVVEAGVTTARGWLATVPQPSGRQAVIKYTLPDATGLDDARQELRILASSLRFEPVAPQITSPPEPGPTGTPLPTPAAPFVVVDPAGQGDYLINSHLGRIISTTLWWSTRPGRAITGPSARPLPE